VGVSCDAQHGRAGDICAASSLTGVRGELSCGEVVGYEFAEQDPVRQSTSLALLSKNGVAQLSAGPPRCVPHDRPRQVLISARSPVAQIHCTHSGFYPVPQAGALRRQPTQLGPSAEQLAGSAGCQQEECSCDSRLSREFALPPSAT